MLANVYLHEVLDKWFVRDVLPRLTGKAFMIRYADDAVMVFSSLQDAERVLAVLPKRFGKYGLALHPEKTKLVRFMRPTSRRGGAIPTAVPDSLDFLGFTHYWGKSRSNRWTIKQKTGKDRFTRAVKRISEWCRRHRHLSVRQQHASLVRKLLGHNQYYGITGNFKALWRFSEAVKETWRKWLNRRSQRGGMHWARFQRLLSFYPLPRPRVAHSAVRQAASP
jgi:RNA-directed DNA polymerase